MPSLLHANNTMMNRRMPGSVVHQMKYHELRCRLGNASHPLLLGGARSSLGNGIQLSSKKWNGINGARFAMKYLPTHAKNGQRRGFMNTPSNMMSSSSTRRPLGALWGIIGVNVAVYGMWQIVQTTAEQNFMLKNFTVSLRGLEEGRWHTLLTSSISHQDFYHLLGNMIGLYFFGADMLMAMGPQKFLGLYATGAVVSSLCQVGYHRFVIASETSAYRGIGDSWANYRTREYYERLPVLGASGSVNTFITMNTMMFPHNTVLVYGLIPIKAYLFGALFVLHDVWGLSKRNNSVANAGHLGGVAVGAAYYLRYLRPLMR